jgi:NMD protein affecting ribosome stability and mRNA decay
MTNAFRILRLPHRPRAHVHRAVNRHVVVQKAGIPYELERTVCADCSRVLSERRLRRTAA